MIDPKVVDVVALFAITMFGLAVWLMNTRPAVRWSVVVPLVAGTVGVVVVLVEALWTREPWLLALAAMEAVLAAVVWAVHRYARTGEPTWFYRLVAMRVMMAGRWQTMDQLRAEYGQALDA